MYVGSIGFNRGYLGVTIIGHGREAKRERMRTPPPPADPALNFADLDGTKSGVYPHHSTPLYWVSNVDNKLLAKNSLSRSFRPFLLGRHVSVSSASERDCIVGQMRSLYIMLFTTWNCRGVRRNSDVLSLLKIAAGESRTLNVRYVIDV
jgi:hypothetical protein